jgi:hypothetical protein
MKTDAIRRGSGRIEADGAAQLANFEMALPLRPTSSHLASFQRVEGVNREAPILVPMPLR